MIRASIDLGTNTCLLLIAECDPKSGVVERTISDHTRIVRLGEGVDQKRELKDTAMERTLKALQEYTAEMKKAGVDPAQALCVATSQARDAKNGRDFFDRVERETGLRFRVISGDDEAKYTFLGGLLPKMDPSNAAIIDIGGGSTEIIALKGGKSLDIGSVRFTERYLTSNPVTDSEFWACQDAIDQALAELQLWRKSLMAPQLVGVAGTVVTLAMWHLGMKEFQASKIDQTTLTRGDVHRMVEELKWRDLDERKSLPGVEPGRADVLLAGSMILWRSMEVLSFPELYVSTRGLRYGVLQMGKESNPS